MRRAWLSVRSFVLWTVTYLHFFVAAPTLVFLAAFLDPRKHDWLQRAFAAASYFSPAQKFARSARRISIRTGRVSSW